MKAIRLTANERDYLKQKLDGDMAKPAVSLLSKIETAESGGARPGLGARAAVEAFRSVLGDRLIVPPDGASGVYAIMSSRIRALGLTAEDCVAIAGRAAVEWSSGRIRAESLVRQADALLTSGVLAPSRTAPQPSEMEDM